MGDEKNPFDVPVGEEKNPFDVPVDSKKKESSAGSLTGSESTTPSPSTSTSEIPTVQITDGEIDAAPLNRPSTMPYGVKMGEDGNIMADTEQDRKKRISDQNRVKRIEFLKQKTAHNFKENPELYSDPKNRDNYYKTLLKFYKPEDVAEIVGNDRWQDEGAGLITTTYRPNPITGESDIYHEDSNNTIKQPFQTIGEATGEGLLGAKEKIVKAHETLSPLPQDQLKAGLGMTAGLVQGAMGIGNIAVPEFAAFTLGTKQAEESLPIVNKVMAPLASGLESYYKDSGKQPPSWMEDAASLGDFAWNYLLFKGAMKAGKKLSFADVDKAVKSMSPSDIEAVASKISEKHNTAEATAPESTVPKMPEDAGEPLKQLDADPVLNHVFNIEREDLLKSIDFEEKYISDKNKKRGTIRKALDKVSGVKYDKFLEGQKEKLSILEKDPLLYLKNELSEQVEFKKKYPEDADDAHIEYLNKAIDRIERLTAGELFKQNDVAMEEANNLSSQAETLKADLEKAKGTPAEPIIAQKIEELNTKIDEIHNNEVEKQTAEAHTLSALDHLQKQKEQITTIQQSLSPEGQKALEPEIQKVDDMIKEVEPKKEEVKEVVPDNEVKEIVEDDPLKNVSEEEFIKINKIVDKLFKKEKLSSEEQTFFDNNQSAVDTAIGRRVREQKRQAEVKPKKKTNATNKETEGNSAESLLEKYNTDTHYGIGDLVDGIEEIAKENGDTKLSEAVRKYRDEEDYNFEISGRNDMTAAEDNFVKSVEDHLSGKKEAVTVEDLPDHIPAEDIPDFTDEQIEQAYKERDKEAGRDANVSYKEQFIHDYFPRMTKEDFMHYGDRNWIVKGDKKKGGTLRRMALNYFKKDALPLDVSAQELSEMAGVEITPQDIVDYVMRRELEPDLFKTTKVQILNKAAEIPMDAAEEIKKFKDLWQDYTTIESVEAARGFPLSDAEADLIIDYLKNNKNEKATETSTSASVQTPNEPVAESKGVEEVNPDKGELTSINDQLSGESDPIKPKTDAKENGTSSAEGSSKEGSVQEGQSEVRMGDSTEPKKDGENQVGDNNSTGIKNRIYDAERAAEGKPVIDTSTGKSKAESYEETVKKIDDGDITPEDIDSVREIAKSGKPNGKYSPEQVQHILIYDKVDLNNQYKKVSKEIVDNADSPSSVAQLQFQRAAIDAKMYDNYVASKKSGTEWSAAGRARQVEVNSDFTVSNLINDYKAAYPGKDIPETVRKQIEKLSSDLEDANKRIDDVLKSRDALNAEIEDIKAKLSESHAKSEIDNPDSAFNKRRAKRSATKEQAKKLILDGKARLAAAAKAQRGTLSANPFSAEMVSAMKDIVEGHVIEKYTDFADLMDRAYQDVKEILPDISMKDFRDAVFEYGKKKTLNQDPHAEQMREIGRLGRLTSAYEDVVSGEAPKRSGLQRDVPTEAEKKLKREITNEMRKRGIEVDSKSPEDKWKTALESFKTRLKNEEFALDQAKENGKLEELLKSKKREKTKLDEEAELLKERVGRKKKEARNIIKQRELEARPWLIKTLDEIKNMKKLFLVSGGSTLETLMGAAWWRAAFKIPNDIISYGLSNIPGLKKVSKNALAENIGTRNDLAKSIASYYKVLLNRETYTKGAVEKFKTGSAKEEVLHGNEKDHILPSTKLLQAVQKWVQLHGAIKYPVFKAKFESAYETILANMIRKGENPESELVQEKAKGLALVEGLRDILNNDNDVVKAQRMIEGFAKNKGNEFAAITIGSQFPITKIASNYFSEMASTLPGGGLARSTPSLIKAIIKGGESLTPEQSDFVMRNLRQTTFGTGLALLGYYGYKQISPFYGSVRKSTPAPDDNSIFGMNSHLTHNVGFEIMRFFATLHWKQDEAERLHKEGGTSEGLAAGAKGALLKNPYINQVTRLVTTFTGDDSSEKKIEKFVKEELKQTFVPPDIQKIAKYLEIPGFENYAKKKLQEEMDKRASETVHLTQEQKDLNKSEMEAREEAKKLLCEQLGVPYVPPKSQQKKPHKSSLFRLFQ